MKKAPNEARNFHVEVISWQSGEKKGKGNRIVEKAVIGEEEGDNVYTICYFFHNICEKPFLFLILVFLLCFRWKLLCQNTRKHQKYLLIKKKYPKHYKSTGTKTTSKYLQ